MNDELRALQLEVLRLQVRVEELEKKVERHNERINALATFARDTVEFLRKVAKLL